MWLNKAEKKGLVSSKENIILGFIDLGWETEMAKTLENV